MGTTLPPDERLLGERETLESMLAYYRAVLLRKAEGLTPKQLQISVGASPLTIGGLVLHTALAEDIWFHFRLAERAPIAPWTEWEHGLDPGRVFEQAVGMTADEVTGHLRAAIARSEAILAEVDDLDLVLPQPSAAGHSANVRWVLVHMIEEYARHCGHADLLRETADGRTGD
ncbi:MAG: DinB family protein [Actinomycetota bacterium]